MGWRAYMNNPFFRGIGGVVAIGIQLVWGANANASALLNIDFTAHLNSAFTQEWGAAAIGESPSDYWNVYSRDLDTMWNWRADGQLADLKWADGNISPIDLAVTNAAGFWGSGSVDPMMRTYLYPLSRSGEMTVTLTQVPPGVYDLLFYAHGEPNAENGVVKLVSAGKNYGTQVTSSAADWNSKMWIEGGQFVTFRNVEVVAGIPLVATVMPGSSGLAVMNGLQLLKRPTTSTLINVDFTAHLNSAFIQEWGAAAIGESASDYWNVYSRDLDTMWNWRANGQVADLKWADGSVSPIDLSVANAAGFWGSGSVDPMMSTYLYPLSRTGNMTVTLTEVPPGFYDLYFYAHGEPDGENSIVQVISGEWLYGAAATSPLPGWNSGSWTEGAQFVHFRRVEAFLNQPLTILVKPGKSTLAVMNGLQLLTTTGPTGSRAPLATPACIP